MAFELCINGVGDAFSTRHFGTNFLLRRDDFVLAVDCPDLYRRALAENRFAPPKGADGEYLDVDGISAMILTHLHGDHVNGLEMVAAYRRFVRGGVLPLHASEAVLKDLWERRLAVSLGVMWDGSAYVNYGPETYFDLCELVAEAPSAVGPFDVETRLTIHHLPTTALRISDGDVTLGYSCDTAFDEGLIDWLKDCDVILHETSLGPAHTPLYKLMELPAEVREKMLVVHYPDDLLGLEIEELRFARQGEVIQVG
ncbi:ribonuclease Z [Lujinxingia sediminis]|uniref:Ribonuclease Z n=1 Tax=Lujinxingia sediminis TaxID=2480984 RepID=A0ABY0CRE3_9DELT|nr:MBL fold metallo-hydrolase [Lujinxingia sediminis]RVU43148.1 ribonuclease Z [Lujinxingia sediminis]